MQEMQVPSLGWEHPLEKEMQPISVFLPGKSHGQRSLVGYSPCGCKESDIAAKIATLKVIITSFRLPDSSSENNLFLLSNIMMMSLSFSKDLYHFSP